MASCRHFSGRLTHELCADCLRRFCARVFCRFFSVISPALPRNFYTREIAPVTAVVCAAMAALAQAPWHLPFPAGTEREGGKVALQDVRARQNRFSQCDRISTAASIGTAFRLAAYTNPFKPHVQQELTAQQRRVEGKGKQHVSRGINCGNYSTHPSRSTSQVSEVLTTLASLLPSLLQRPDERGRVWGWMMSAKPSEKDNRLL